MYYTLCYPRQDALRAATPFSHPSVVTDNSTRRRGFRPPSGERTTLTKVLKYLKGTLNHGLCLGDRLHTLPVDLDQDIDIFILFGYCDADFATMAPERPPPFPVARSVAGGGVDVRSRSFVRSLSSPRQPKRLGGTSRNVVDFLSRSPPPHLILHTYSIG